VFYRTPTPQAVGSWKEQTGKSFVFTWKASKFITHWKRLSANSVNSLELMEDRLSLLGHKVGSVLFQLPPNFHADADRLSGFLRMLPPKRRYSFEFRHPSWYSPQIMRLLSKENISLCISDHHDAPRTLSISEDTVLVGVIRATIRGMPWRPGPNASGRGKRKATTCLCSSIMTRRAPHRSMP
jgi:uncharacterized protein YecE (DUF72 family)